MKFPIDVAFLSVDLEVRAGDPAQAVARGRGRAPGPQRREAEAGSLERWGVRVGDQLEVREVPNGAASDGP